MLDLVSLGLHAGNRRNLLAMSLEPHKKLSGALWSRGYIIFGLVTANEFAEILSLSATSSISQCL